MTPRARVPGATLRDQAIRVAGALAELGAVAVVVERAGIRAELAARSTDLPGVLVAGVGGVLRCDPLGIEIYITADGLEWSAQDQAAAQTWAQALAT